ncbi:hypothetical protein [Chryseobacterium sp. BIGb0232]|uniref:hypothetical protein n=1 Tax=Chryseobacterium sp. BIGb0232 TaxID=2940598 RepID=UPI000F48F397|nr:hypothetical protein [Chryseobacterium sp. BIGb0232]MCS4300670.1 hypothetical protein [Chryseobacterium sp. BIGb0232]ROS20447.1 hypothetical protein EDF65_1169 [Chryseobacterium nakagawai]
MINPRQFTSYKKAGSSDTASVQSDRILTSYPTETLVEKDKKYKEQKILIPEFSLPGSLAKPELEGLTFHFMAFPTLFEYADFRLIDGNKYELLGFNGKPVPELTSELIDLYTEAMQVYFEQNSEPSVYSEKDTFYHKEDITLLTGKVKWDFSTYLRQTTEVENESLYELEKEGELEYEEFDEDFNYTTDYDLPVFKDENGNTLEFVCRLYAPNFPGSHYLFYSRETQLVRQFSKSPRRQEHQIYFNRLENPDPSIDVLEEISDPSKVFTDPSYFHQMVLLPKYSFPGSIAHKKYTDLRFHFVIVPVFNTWVDFRLTEDNIYEVLCFDDQLPGDFTPEFIKRCEDNIDTYFEEIPEKTRYFIASDTEMGYDSLLLSTGTEPIWDQADYMREKTEEEIQADYDANHMNILSDPFQDRDYVTDYDAPELKDENGDTMVFIAQLYEGILFGSYYLYYSPKTRLVRQFFQCT